MTAYGEALEVPLADHHHVRPQVVVLQRDPHDDGPRVDESHDRNDQNQRPAAELRPALDLNRKPLPIVDAVDEPIHTSIQQGQEYMHAAVRTHDQLDPHLPLRELPDNQAQVPMPGAGGHRPQRSGRATATGPKSIGASDSRLTSSLKMSGRP